MSFDHEMAQRFDQAVDVATAALADSRLTRIPESILPIDGFGSGNVGGRLLVGIVLRAALRARIVYANEKQAEFIALSGSAGHSDTAADLRPAPQPRSEEAE